MAELENNDLERTYLLDLLCAAYPGEHTVLSPFVRASAYSYFDSLWPTVYCRMYFAESLGENNFKTEFLN